MFLRAKLAGRGSEFAFFQPFKIAMGLLCGLLSVSAMSASAHATCSVISAGVVECDPPTIGTGFQNNGFNNGSITLNSGTDQNSSGNSDVIDVGNGNTISVSAGAGIRDSGGNANDGIDAGNSSIINNAGTINVRRNGISVGGGSGGVRTVITNTGTILANRKGVEGGANTTLNNTGTIDANNDGVLLGANAIITNDGLIDGNRYGLDVDAGSVINNNGRVESNNRIVNAQNQNNVTVNNTGIMFNRSSNKGLWLENSSTVVNGDASNSTSLPTALIAGGDDAVLMRDGARLVNYANGVIRGGDPNNNLSNAGAGGDADGVDIQDGSVLNYGLITTLQTGNEAIEISSTLRTQTLTVENHGRISADVGIREYQTSGGASAADPSPTTRGQQTIINYDGGVIEGTGALAGTASGTLALDLGRDNDQLRLHGNSQIIGDAWGGRNIVNGNFSAGSFQPEDDQLVLDGSSAGSFDAAELSDNGGTTRFREWETLVKDGTSVWTLSGNNNGAFTGDTLIRAGELVNDANLDNSDFTVIGGLLSGTGTSGATTISGGVHDAAGAGMIGTYNVSGDYTINGGTLRVDVDDAGGSDTIIVTGTVNVTGGTLMINELPGAWNGTTDYVLIDNDGSDAVIGQFANVTNQLAFLDVTVGYQGLAGDPGTNDVVLTLTRNNAAFTSVANTPNQRATAGGVSTLDVSSPGSATIVNAITGLTAPEAANAYDQLSGEVHASVAGALSAHGGRVFSAIGDRVADRWSTTGVNAATLTGRALTDVSRREGDGDAEQEVAEYAAILAENSLGFWAQGAGDWRVVEGDGNGDRQDTEAYDVLIGTDLSGPEHLTFGIVSGYSGMTLDLDDRGSAARVETARSGAYLSYLQPNWQASVLGAYAFHQIDTTRHIIFPGFDRTANAEYQAHDISLKGQVGHTARFSNVFFHPFIGLHYNWQHRDGFAEAGADAANLMVQEQDTHSLKSSVGLKIAGEYRVRGATITPEAQFVWHHELADVTGETTHNFIEGSEDFTVKATKPSRNTFDMSLGMRANFDSGFGAYFNTNASVSGNERSHGTRAGMKMQF